jgi:hypothetical protein
MRCDKFNMKSNVIRDLRSAAPFWPFTIVFLVTRVESSAPQQTV